MLNAFQRTPSADAYSNSEEEKKKQKKRKIQIRKRLLVTSELWAPINLLIEFKYIIIVHWARELASACRRRRRRRRRLDYFIATRAQY